MKYKIKILLLVMASAVSLRASIPTVVEMTDAFSAAGSICGVAAAVGFSVWIYQRTKKAANDALDESYYTDEDGNDWTQEQLDEAQEQLDEDDKYQ